MGKDRSIVVTVARQNWAKYIAIVVRNAMEDFHHKNLSDEQMKELNPIIRNAIYSAIYAHDNRGESGKAERFVEYNMSMIPDYWEAPELLEYLKE